MFLFVLETILYHDVIFSRLLYLETIQPLHVLHYLRNGSLHHVLHYQTQMMRMVSSVETRAPTDPSTWRPTVSTRR